MAEILGVIASAITVAEVAAQAGGAIPKLKALWDEVQNVPDTIENLLEQIEILHVLLEEVNKPDVHRTSTPVLRNDAMSRIRLCCEKSLQRLTEIVNDLNTQIHNQKKMRRGLARAKVVLKKGVIDKHEARLRNAVMMFGPAQLIYLKSLMLDYPQITADRVIAIQERKRHEETASNMGLLDHPLKNSTNQASDEAQIATRNAHSKRPVIESKRFIWKRQFGHGAVVWYISESSFRGNQITNYSLRLQFPYWLLNRSWEIRISKGQCYCTAMLRDWRVVSDDDSAAFQAIESDDVVALRRSLETRQSTLYDRTHEGFTLLHIAIMNLHLNCSRLLQDAGLSIHEPNNHAGTPLDYFGNATIPETIETQDVAWIAAWHEVLQSTDAFDDPSRSFVAIYMATIFITQSNDELAFILRLNDPLKDRMLWGIRFYLFIPHMFWGRPVLKSSTYIFALGNALLLPYLLRDGVVGDLAFVIGNREWPLPDQEDSDWREGAKMLLRGDGFHQDWLHSTEFWGRCRDNSGAFDATPLVLLLRGYCRSEHEGRSGYRKKKGLVTTLRFWLGLLQQNQVDLMTYGHRERQFVLKNRPEINVIYSTHHTPLVSRLSERLFDIQFGPDPEDWAIVYEVDVERMAGEFWTSLKEPELVVPGQWVDE